MYTRIVIPVDGSELAERALPHAEEMARLFNAPIHLVRVIDMTRLEGYGPYGLALEYATYDQITTTEQTAAETYLATVEKGLGERGVTVTHEIRRGVVRQELNAVTRGGDLVVMASHGRGGLSRWFLGSVAEDIVRRATVPVLLVRTAMPAEEPAGVAAATASGG